jgi:hypothetical protein
MSAILPSAPKALAHLDRLEIEIRNAPSFAKVEAARREAKGYAENFKPVKGVADRAGEVWTAAERKINAEYKKIGKAKGTRGQLRGSKPGKGQRGKPGSRSGPSEVAAPDLTLSQAELGLNRNSSSAAIYARKGSPIFIDTKDFFVCNAWPRQEHSRKPKEFYDLIRRVTGGSRIDVFSREAHEGFAQYGNEIDKFKDAAE